METKDCAYLSIMFKKHLVCLYVWIKIIFFIVIYYFNQNDTREQNMEKFFNDIKWIVWYERIVKIFISFILHCEKICLYVSKIYKIEFTWIFGEPCNRIIVHTNYQQNRNRKKSSLASPSLLQQDIYFLLHPYREYCSSYLPFISGIFFLSLHLVPLVRCFFLSQNWILLKIFLSIVQEINLVEQRDRLNRHRTLYFTLINLSGLKITLFSFFLFRSRNVMAFAYLPRFLKDFASILVPISSRLRANFPA